VTRVQGEGEETSIPRFAKVLELEAALIIPSHKCKNECCNCFLSYLLSTYEKLIEILQIFYVMVMGDETTQKLSK
jgi:hypothetical protein